MVSGLKRMEYRGYDSVGIATKVENAVQIRKGVGRVDEVNKAENLDGLEGTVGIGHTRWATHGKVTRSNAHPHASNTSMVAFKLKPLSNGAAFLFRNRSRLDLHLRIWYYSDFGAASAASTSGFSTSAGLDSSTFAGLDSVGIDLDSSTSV